MTTHVVNTHDAKSRLSELIRAAHDGDEVIVARNGRPVARIVAWTAVETSRVPGSWSGLIDYGGEMVGADEEIGSMFDESADADDP